jgi:hypothetical protein
MKPGFTKSQIALAALAAIGTTCMAFAPTMASAAGKTAGKYVAGDFHNHTTCSDGSISMQKLVKKSTETWNLDWFVQAGHGGNGNRNCTLAEDESLATPAYPLVYSTTGVLQGPTTTWQNTNPAVQPKGLVSGSAPNQNMWRWQSLQEFQYPLLEYLSANKNKPLFLGVESVVAGHEHASMSVITGQMPASLDTLTLPATGPYTALGNANALAQWEYCFDRNDTDRSRGNTTLTSGVGNNWNCSVTGSLNAADTVTPWNAEAQKLIPSGGTGTGNRGHGKTVEAMKWMAEFHPQGSYYIPAHLERAGPFNPNGNNGFNIEHLRNFNNAAPNVAFGFETQPGHGASSDRGEYATRRNNIGGVNVDSVGGVTYGGTGVYGAQIGGVWDALLGEGRNFWFFASSDWHNRGSFGADDRRSTQDFQPGEYQRNYTMVRNGSDKLRPQAIVDGLRSGNNFAASGQLIDRMSFIACTDYPNATTAKKSTSATEGLAVTAAVDNTDIDKTSCATMGEKLVVSPGADIIVAVVVRDPVGKNNSPYSFPNPSLMQIGMNQPLDAPVLDHIDVIGGLVTGYKTPGTADYAGQWPNTWHANPDMSTVPAAAKNTSARVIKTFNGSTWRAAETAGPGYVKMSFRIPAVQASQYVRLRGTNLPANVPFETDASGNPLSDLATNAGAVNPSVPGGADGIPANVNLQIPCKTAGTTEFNGCPSHLPSKTVGAYTGKFVAYDVAAWSDLWFYSNPIYIEVKGTTTVAGVK